MFKPSAILFDLDGVLLDTEDINSKIWEEVLKKIGLEISKNQINNFRGKTRKDCAEIISNYSDNLKTARDILDIHKPIFDIYMNEIYAVDFAEKTIDIILNKDIKMALVTSSSEESYKRKVNAQKFLSKIKIKVLGDNPELKNGKPSPEPYLMACKLLNVNPSDCWVIEDSLSGIRSGYDAGCFVFCLDRNKILKKELLLNNLIKKDRIKIINDLSDLKNLF